MNKKVIRSSSTTGESLSTFVMVSFCMAIIPCFLNKLLEYIFFYFRHKLT